MSNNNLRAYFHVSGTNPEIEGPYYELSSFAAIVGCFNFESLTLGFRKGLWIDSATFRPIDPTKPIVLAVDGQTDIGFIVIDHHLEEGAEAGMRNYSYFKTDKFLIDCKRRDVLGNGQSKEYWSVTSQKMTFVFGGVDAPNAWRLRDGDLLCALIAGELNANQLRMHAYLAEREAGKEVRREELIRKLSGELRTSDRRIQQLLDRVQRAEEQSENIADISEEVVHRAVNDAVEAHEKHDSFVSSLELAMSGLLPFVRKEKLRQVIRNHE